MEIPKYDAHICFVTDQNVPNYLPIALNNGKIRTVFLIATPHISGKIKLLTETIGANKCNIYELNDTSLKSMEENLRDIINGIYNKGKNIAFNLTGGTKLMFSMARDICKNMNPEIPCFYIDTYKKRYVEIDTQAEHELPDIMTVRDILNLYGTKVEKIRNTGLIRTHQDVVEYLATLDDNKKEDISVLHGEIGRINTDRHNPKLSISIPKGSILLDNILNRLQASRLLTIANNEIKFKNKEDKEYCGGKWFEDYVGRIVYELKDEGKITDCFVSAEVFRNYKCKPIKNELDVVFTANNQLFVIECKAWYNTRTEAAVDAMYKIDDLRNKIGGILASQF